MGCNITFIKIGYFCFTTLRHWPLWTALYELIKHFRYGEEHDLLILCWWDENHWVVKMRILMISHFTILLKNRLSYRSFISTWRIHVRRLLVYGMSYSQTLSNSFCTLTDVFLYCTLSDAFFYPTNSILLDIIRHTVLFFTYAWHTIPLFIHWRMKIFSEIFNVKRRLTFR